MSFQPRTPIEHFRIKSVEPLCMTKAELRRSTLKAFGYNFFLLRLAEILLFYKRIRVKFIHRRRIKNEKN